jgi:DNA-binding transcriptional LysR family regulator
MEADKAFSMKKIIPAPVNFIRSFEAAARHLSFSRAAEELGYTQAAVSAHMRSLEKYLGHALFIRHARSIELTETGEALLPTLRQALHQIDMATDAVIRSGRDKSIVLSCPMSLAEGWLPNVLRTFRTEYPETEVAVYGTVWERPGGNPADIVISLHRDDEVPTSCRMLISERLSLVCAPQFAAEIRTPRDVLDLPHIQVSGRQEFFEIFFRSHGLDHDATGRGVLKTNATNICLELAAAGHGVTIAPSTLVAPYLRRNLLVKPLDESYPSPWSYYLSIPSPRPSTMVNKMVDLLMQASSA